MTTTMMTMAALANNKNCSIVRVRVGSKGTCPGDREGEEAEGAQSGVLHRLPFDAIV